MLGTKQGEVKRRYNSLCSPTPPNCCSLKCFHSPGQVSYWNYLLKLKEYGFRDEFERLLLKPCPRICTNYIVYRIMYGVIVIVTKETS